MTPTSAVAAVPVVGPVPEATLAPPEAAPGALLRALHDDPNAMVYFLLNVGDGDTQLILLPPDSGDGIRRLVIVDVATAGKLPALIAALHAADDPNHPGEPKASVAGTLGKNVIDLPAGVRGRYLLIRHSKERAESWWTVAEITVD